MKFKFNLTYFALALILFLIEVLIALYAHDQFIRPILGDVLVVILLYCLVKAFITSSAFKTSIAVLLFSYIVEFLQYLQFVKIIGLENNKLATIVIGNFFSWTDILAYTLGIGIVLFAERIRSPKQTGIK